MQSDSFALTDNTERMRGHIHANRDEFSLQLTHFVCVCVYVWRSHDEIYGFFYCFSSRFSPVSTDFITIKSIEKREGPHLPQHVQNETRSLDSEVAFSAKIDKNSNAKQFEMKCVRAFEITFTIIFKIVNEAYFKYTSIRSVVWYSTFWKLTRAPTHHSA